MLKIFAKYPKLFCAANVAAIDLIYLRDSGAKVIVLDYDGVLVPHKGVFFDAVTQSFVTQAVEVFGSGNVYILSNRPELARKLYIEENFRGVSFVDPKYKKPNPYELLRIISRHKINSSALVMIDDRLATGVLAGKRANSIVFYITNPCVDFKQNPISESWFFLLRKIEAILY